MTYVITEPCTDVMDKGCVEECPVDCSYEGQRMLPYDTGYIASYDTGR